MNCSGLVATPAVQLLFIVGHEVTHTALFHHSEQGFYTMFLSNTIDDIICTGLHCVTGPLTVRAARHPCATIQRRCGSRAFSFDGS